MNEKRTAEAPTEQPVEIRNDVRAYVVTVRPDLERMRADLGDVDLGRALLARNRLKQKRVPRAGRR